MSRRKLILLAVLLAALLEALLLPTVKGSRGPTPRPKPHASGPS